MALYLVEEHTCPLEGQEMIPFVVLVEADNVAWAFQAANKLSEQTRLRPVRPYEPELEPFTLFFDPSEIVNVIDGYLWKADEEDSDIWYEIRYLGPGLEAEKEADKRAGCVIRGTVSTSNHTGGA